MGSRQDEQQLGEPLLGAQQYGLRGPFHDHAHSQSHLDQNAPVQLRVALAGLAEQVGMAMQAQPAEL